MELPSIICTVGTEGGREKELLRSVCVFNNAEFKIPLWDYSDAEALWNDDAGKPVTGPHWLLLKYLQKCSINLLRTINSYSTDVRLHIKYICWISKWAHVMENSVREGSDVTARISLVCFVRDKTNPPSALSYIRSTLQLQPSANTSWMLWWMISNDDKI